MNFEEGSCDLWNTYEDIQSNMKTWQKLSIWKFNIATVSLSVFSLWNVMKLQGSSSSSRLQEPRIPSSCLLHLHPLPIQNLELSSSPPNKRSYFCFHLRVRPAAGMRMYPSDIYRNADQGTCHTDWHRHSTSFSSAHMCTNNINETCKYSKPSPDLSSWSGLKFTHTLNL